MPNRDPSALRHLGSWARSVFVGSILVVAGWPLGKGILSYLNNIAVFELRRIEVRGNNILTRAEVVKTMAVPLTGSVFDVDLPALQGRVEELDYVYGVRLGRKLPHTLFVDLVENQPLAYVAAPEYYLLTDEQEALPLPHGRFELELPTVSGADSALKALALGSVNDHAQLQQAWKILHYIYASFPSLYQELSELVFADNGEITLYMTETSTAVRLGSQELEQRIATLDAFLLTVSGKRSLIDYSYIDLRYNRQVVVRERA
ncbi:MAG: cell division protein FtsQ/DivIB [Candidatus Neomarinimicrobiota bacterium]